MNNKVETWDDAYKWQESANKKWEDFHTPKWSWDCGLKLDFDGELFGISSRFYPEGDNKWKGNVTILLLDEEVTVEKFEAKDINELKDEVELFIYNITQQLKVWCELVF